MTRTLSLLIFLVICAGCFRPIGQNQVAEVTQFRYQQHGRDIAFEITLSPGVHAVQIQVAYIDADGNATIHPGNLFEYTIPDYRKSAMLIDAFTVSHAGIVRMYIVKNGDVITRIDIPVAYKPA